MKARLGFVRGRSLSDTLRLYVNVFWHRLIDRPLKLGQGWQQFPFDIRDRVFWWSYLKAWADPAARTWYVNPEPDFPYKDYIRPDSVGIDVGAHRGYWTLAHAIHVRPPGAVFLLEPHPENYYHLVRNLRVNQLSAHYPLPFAVWSEQTWLTLSDDQKYRTSYTFAIERKKGNIFCTSVDNIVDFFHIDRIDWIKIDAEGSEIEILRGAQKTLRIFSPVVWVEVQAENESALQSLLPEIGYRIEQREDFSELAYYWLVPAEK